MLLFFVICIVLRWVGQNIFVISIDDDVFVVSACFTVALCPLSATVNNFAGRKVSVSLWNTKKREKKTEMAYT